MKNALLILILGISYTYGFSQVDKDVPQLVKERFATLYPDTKVTAWEMEDEGYEASFKVNDVETSVVMSVEGKVVLTEVEIKPESLPRPAFDFVETQLRGLKITSASKIVTVEGIVTYEAEVGNDDYLFDSDGQFISHEEEEDDDEEDD